MLLRDYEYVRNTIFFLDEGYRRLLPDFRQVATDTRLVPRASLVDESSVAVYANEFGTGESTSTGATRFGVACFDVNCPGDNRTGYVE